MNKEQVRKFYEVIWDSHNKEAISTLLDNDVTFRGSLGQEKRGHAGFAEYVDMVHKALGEYKCIIEELESEKQELEKERREIEREFIDYLKNNKQIININNNNNKTIYNSAYIINNFTNPYNFETLMSPPLTKKEIRDILANNPG